MPPAYRGEWRPLFDARMMIHFQLTSILLGMGFLLLLPANTFGTTPAWSYFAAVTSENGWGALFLLFGGIGATGLTTSSKGIRLASIFVLATVHSIMAAFFLAGNPTGGASWTYANVALAGFYLAWRQAIGAFA